jgi:hypothetical protein
MILLDENLYIDYIPSKERRDRRREAIIEGVCLIVSAVALYAATVLLLAL